MMKNTLIKEKGFVAIPFSAICCGNCGKTLEKATVGEKENELICDKCGSVNKIFAFSAGSK